MDSSSVGPPPAEDRANDRDRFGLRRFLEALVAAGECEIREQPIELADVAAELESDKAIWFKAAGPERAELVGNVVGSRARLALAFGVKPSELMAEVVRRLKNKPELIEVARADAPVQEVVQTGDDVDLTALPVHLSHGLDGAPYISASVDYVRDTVTGLTNVGVRRLMLRGKSETGVDLVSPSDLRAIYEAHAARGENLPVAFAVGSHPIDMVAATMRVPVDELGLVASLRDAPLNVVKCISSDIRVPADAEYVIEGYFDARGHVESEGPFGEFLGYYGGVKQNPVFHCTAIAHRRDAIFQTASIGGYRNDRTDTALLNAIRTEATIWQALITAVREPLNVYATPSSGGMFNTRISLRQRVPGEARNAILAAFACLANIKNVFVVDPDIDIFSDAQIDWALATRFQPDRDLIVAGGLRTLPLDPSITHGTRVGSKAGFDLTWPFGTGGALERSVPEVPQFKGKRFDSLDAALADGPKYFEELMTALGSRDGREIVRALDVIRKAGKLTRDERGRWALR
ncbi:MAG TPA: UbiD family decarboxylase, partial [Stellaceae bacterium]|nr:UbiD family decarboxylase [Stellaceae bacterium]